jgi:hypothetical protein
VQRADGLTLLFLPTDEPCEWLMRTTELTRLADNSFVSGNSNLSPMGDISIDTIGFKGADCEKATAHLEEALGWSQPKPGSLITGNRPGLKLSKGSATASQRIHFDRPVLVFVLLPLPARAIQSSPAFEGKSGIHAKKSAVLPHNNETE